MHTTTYIQLHTYRKTQKFDLPKNKTPKARSTVAYKCP